MSFFRGFQQAHGALLAQPRELLVLRLTLVVMILYASTIPAGVEKVCLYVFCGLMLIHQPLVRSRFLWGAVFAVLLYCNALFWWYIDNHKILMTYWSLVCWLAVASRDAEAVLVWNGRVLLGLVMLFGTFWKLAPGEYLDGSFLHATFLTGNRLEIPSMVVGGPDADQLRDNRYLLGMLLARPGENVAVTLTTTSWLRAATKAASYWTILIEGSVALSFLLSRPRWLACMRDALLMLFVLTTYSLLPIVGFGSILVLLGFAQCPRERRRTRIAYLYLLHTSCA